MGEVEQSEGVLSPRGRLLRGISRIAPIGQLATGIAAFVLGAVLVLAPINVHGIAVITGAGLAVIGLATFITAPRAHADGALVLPMVSGVLLFVFGVVMALIPASGAPWLAFLAGSGLLLHGIMSAVTAFNRSTEQRVTVLITAVATALVGIVTFSWPVLTLTVFRFAVGAWLIFFGLHLLIAMLFHRGKYPSPKPQPLTKWRRLSRTVGACLALACSIALVWGTAWLTGGVALPEPGDFYTAPEHVPDEPGQLLRSEAITVGVPEGAEAWKILYTTTMPDGSPAISSGTVIAPRDRGSDTLPLLTVAHGTTGVASKCAPSMSATPFADGAGAALEEMVVKHSWVGVISDYVGLGTAGTHPYLVGEAEARNSLDASRAAQQLDMLNTTTDTVVWGHSQGGQAALWIGQIAADYAPEITIKGVAAFAPAADLFGLAEADKNDPAGKTVSAYIASTWDEIYPDLRLTQQLTPGSAGGVRKIHNLCFNGKDALGAILTGTQVPNQIFPDSLLDGALGDLLKAQTPVGPWPAPVLVAQGLDDPLVRPNLQQGWVDGRCTAGLKIDYRTFPGRDHVSLVAADSPLTPQLVQWTLDRWNELPATPNCGGS